MWFNKISPGAVLAPIPLWNATEQPKNHLAKETVVLDITTDVCQSGVLFKVKTRGGACRWLDAAWFEPPPLDTAPLQEELFL